MSAAAGKPIGTMVSTFRVPSGRYVASGGGRAIRRWMHHPDGTVIHVSQDATNVQVTEDSGNRDIRRVVTMATVTRKDGKVISATIYPLSGSYASASKWLSLALREHGMPSEHVAKQLGIVPDKEHKYD